jgi:hypothetical protein
VTDPLGRSAKRSWHRATGGHQTIAPPVSRDQAFHLGAERWIISRGSVKPIGARVLGLPKSLLEQVQRAL